MSKITAKELGAIQDIMGNELNLVKKFNMYAGMTQDEGIKTKCQEMAGQHQKHFDILFKHLS